MKDERIKRRPVRTPPPPQDPDLSERPTVNPPFDLEAFARANSTPSHQPRPAHEAPTNRPPPPAPVPTFEPESHSERITLTNEVELERARLQSAVVQPAPRKITSGALSIANARAPSAPSADGHDRREEREDSAPPSSIEAAVLGAVGGSAPPEISERAIDDPAAEMRERFSLGDYTGALEICELVLAEDPGDAEALACAESCRTVLENMYAARLGPLHRVPVVIVPRAQMRWLSMDHRAGFILSLVDGSSSVEMILDVCGMSKLDALRILQALVEQKVVSFR